MISTGKGVEKILGRKGRRSERKRPTGKGGKDLRKERKREISGGGEGLRGERVGRISTGKGGNLRKEKGEDLERP